ncbi:MAG: hypothetical protein MHM6MM_000143 [Cercozoa sp. M6MM]
MVEIVAQVRDWVAVNKPHDLCIDDVREHLESTLKRRVWPCHQLDKPTSGVLVFALSKDAARELCEAFAARVVKKEYLALVEGILHTPRNSLLLDFPLAQKDEANYAQCVPEKGHPYPPKSAVTLVESVHVSSERTLVRLLLHTGRRHQLRVHLSHLNHAIVGDAMYNADRSDSDSRLMLHAHRLVVPLRSCTLQLHAPCPFLPAAVRLDTSGIRVPPMLPPFLTLTSVLDTHVERCTRVLLMPYTTRDQTVTVWLHRQTRRCRHRLVPIRGDHLSPLQCRRSSGHADLCDSAMSLLFEDHEALQHARRVRHSLTQQPLCAETESVRAVRRFPFAVYFVPEQWLEGRKQELQPVDVHLSQLNSRNSQLDVDDIVHLLVKDAFVDNSDNRNIVHCENLPGFHDAERHLCFHFQHAVAHGENTEAACNARLLSQCEKRHFFIDEVNERAAIAHRFRKQAEREEREQNEKQGFARAAKQGVEIIRSIFAARQEKLQTSTPVRSFAQLFCGRPHCFEKRETSHCWKAPMLHNR